jgi:transcriptional regulator with XRE-family HTH domain
MARRGEWPPSGYGARLRQHRDAAKLTQAALAERAGVMRETIAKFELSLIEPSWPAVLCLAKALDLTPDDFMPVVADSANDQGEDRATKRPASKKS